MQQVIPASIEAVSCNMTAEMPRKSNGALHCPQPNTSKHESSISSNDPRESAKGGRFSGRYPSNDRYYRSGRTSGRELVSNSHRIDFRAVKDTSQIRCKQAPGARGGRQGKEVRPQSLDGRKHRAGTKGPGEAGSRASGSQATVFGCTQD